MMHIQNTNFNQIDAIKHLLYFLQKIDHDVSRMTSPELKESKSFRENLPTCHIWCLWSVAQKLDRNKARLK